MEARDIEFILKVNDPDAARFLTVRVGGETVSGRTVDRTHRAEVSLMDGEAVREVPVDILLDAYDGIRGEPVSGPAFVGRERELGEVEKTLLREKPGAVLLYGARRLGKTSLLDELRRRHSAPFRSGSRTVFLVIPVDLFELGDASRSFSADFFQHVAWCVCHDGKNAEFRQLLAKSGHDLRQLQEAAKCGEPGAPFGLKLAMYLRRLLVLCGGGVQNIVLIMDEFDKLLEHYRKGYQNAVEELISQLRRIATEDAHTGVLLAGSDLMKRLVGHYRSAFYGSAVDIELKGFNLEQDFTAAAEIICPDSIKAYRQFPDNALREVMTITGGHPLYMRLVGCAASFISGRKRVSVTTVREATKRLLLRNILQGETSDPVTLVRGPLQALKLLKTDADQDLGLLLLLHLAVHTSLERPWAQWAVVVQNEDLLALRTEVVWTRTRDDLRDAGILMSNEKRMWTFRFPILAEALRHTYHLDHQRLVESLNEGAARTQP
jgi:hypothetical protein